MAKRIPNEIIVLDDIVKIVITQRNGRQHVATVDRDAWKFLQYFHYKVSQTPAGLFYVRFHDRDGVLKYLHHAVLWCHTIYEDMEIDHLDRDTMNNRRSNLKICSTSENARNRGPKKKKEQPNASK